ncbi:MAG: phosphoribosyl-AMP cyclohydrolase [Lachnospiraceae bacterium]|nr:phosphoribosyl-AMP cyclohydrolase [Lachnospiraceae bacterium]
MDNFKKIITYINCESETSERVIRQVLSYENYGSDALFIYNHTEVEEEREKVWELVKEVVWRVDIPVMLGCRVKRPEDIEGAFATGVKYLVVQYDDVKNNDLMKAAAERFGRDALVLEADASIGDFTEFFNDETIKKAEHFGRILLKHVTVSNKLADCIKAASVPVIIRDSLIRNDIETLISIDGVFAVATNFYAEKSMPTDNFYTDGEGIPAGRDIMKVKLALKSAGINVDVFESKLTFADLAKNSDGLVPCIVQDYKNNEVLMLAYMNEESFNLTVETGIMTYFSRSRQELWKKGATSGHYQYVKELSADCDKDTLLAKVNQIGAACHTGRRSCFFNEMLKHEY